MLSALQQTATWSWFVIPTEGLLQLIVRAGAIYQCGKRTTLSQGAPIQALFQRPPTLLLPHHGSLGTARRGQKPSRSGFYPPRRGQSSNDDDIFSSVGRIVSGRNRFSDYFQSGGNWRNNKSKCLLPRATANVIRSWHFMTQRSWEEREREREGTKRKRARRRQTEDA